MHANANRPTTRPAASWTPTPATGARTVPWNPTRRRSITVNGNETLTARRRRLLHLPAQLSDNGAADHGRRRPSADLLRHARELRPAPRATLRSTSAATAGITSTGYDPTRQLRNARLLPAGLDDDPDQHQPRAATRNDQRVRPLRARTPTSTSAATRPTWASSPASDRIAGNDAIEHCTATPPAELKPALEHWQPRTPKTRAETRRRRPRRYYAPQSYVECTGARPPARRPTPTADPAPSAARLARLKLRADRAELDKRTYEGEAQQQPAGPDRRRSACCCSPPDSSCMSSMGGGGEEEAGSRLGRRSRPAAAGAKPPRHRRPKRRRDRWPRRSQALGQPPAPPLPRPVDAAWHGERDRRPALRPRRRHRRRLVAARVDRLDGASRRRRPSSSPRSRSPATRRSPRASASTASRRWSWSARSSLHQAVPTASVSYGFQSAQSVVQAVIDAGYRARPSTTTRERWTSGTVPSHLRPVPDSGDSTAPGAPSPKQAARPA